LQSLLFVRARTIIIADYEIDVPIEPRGGLD
jgi:hypothetical protein